ncbi:hypothetical protein SAMN05421503_0401 [Terribacillus aidingensis]|uniref:Uncharacterized protein n=1 Tax=Terribacillus aidingensis TaxID=586416 RepID=A0A285N2P4_9BACI|nr:hypothetical protein SAMN05421503_0401 [Terribacillus aidingensis]
MKKKQIASLIKRAPAGYQIPDKRLLPFMTRYGKTN